MAYESKDVDAMIAALQAHDKAWVSNVRSLGLTPKDWTPRLVGPEKSVAYIHAVEELSDAWRDRIKLAIASGFEVHLACPSLIWQHEETLTFAVEHHLVAIELVEDDGDWSVKLYRSGAELIARNGLALASSVRQELCRKARAASREATSNAKKGSTFEDFLLLLFSGVNDFEFFDRNVNTATEEIDLVFMNRGVSQRIWSGTRLIVISAKNWSSTIGRRHVSDLETYVQNRRGQCKLGLLCAARDVSEDAVTEVLRTSREDHILVLLEDEDYETLMDEVSSLDESLERIVMAKSILA